jgi:hypothetical protein
LKLPGVKFSKGEDDLLTGNNIVGIGDMGIETFKHGQEKRKIGV